MLKRSFILFLIVLISLPTLIPPPIAEANQVRTVYVYDTYRPGYYWCQHSDGSWSTNSSLDGPRTAEDAGGEPEKTWVRTQANISAPTSNWFYKDTEEQYFGNFSDIQNIRPVDVPDVSPIMDPSADPNIDGDPYIEDGRVIMQGYSGKGITLDEAVSERICGDNVGVAYPFPIEVMFEGEVIIPDEPKLIGFRISPETATIYTDESQQYEGYARYEYQGEEYEEQVQANQVSWSSYNLDVASINSNGLASPDWMLGSVTITGTYEGLTDTALLTVLPREAVITGLEIYPEMSTVSVHGEESYTARLVYSDGEKKSIASDQVNWSISNTSIATINGSGVATGHSEGRVTITGTYEEHQDTAILNVIAGDILGDFTINPNPVEFGQSFDFTETRLVNYTGKEIESIDWRIHHPDGQNGTVYPKETSTGVTVRSFMYPSFLTDETKDYEVTMRAWLQGEDAPRHLNSKILNILTTATEDDDDGDDNEGGDDGGGKEPEEPEPEPPPNNPPWVEVWFEKDGERITRAVRGDTVELHSDFGDPDGDPLSRRWEYDILMQNYGLSNSAKSQSFRVTNDGQHSAMLTVTDPRGLSAYNTAYLRVIDPTPVAIITGPPAVKEGRPLAYPIEGSRSYSPIPIPLVEYEWTNKRDVYHTPGTETVSLRVQDEEGRWSRRVEHTIRVIADDPPVAQLEVPSQTTRLNQVTIQVTSYSPDLDPIDYHKIEVRYDLQNNNVYGDWITLAEGDIRSVLYDPQQVGKRQFRVTSCESFGLCDTSTPIVMNVENLPPFVDVATSGDLSNPSDKTIVPMSTIFNSWTLRVPSGASGDKSFWRMSNGMLETYFQSNTREFNSSSEVTGGYLNLHGNPTRSFTQGRDNPIQTIYSSLQSSNYNVINLGNFTSDSEVHHDDMFVYTFGRGTSGATIKAFTKDFVAVWAKSYSAYTRAEQIITYNEKLYALIDQSIVIINRSNGEIEKTIDLPAGVGGDISIIAINNGKAVIGRNYTGYALDLLTEEVTPISILRPGYQKYYRVSTDFMYILERAGSSERLIGFNLNNLTVSWERTLKSGGYYWSSDAQNAIMGFNENLEAFMLDKGSFFPYHDYYSMANEGVLSWMNKNGYETHPKMYYWGSNYDEFTVHPIEMIPTENHPESWVIEDYFHDATYPAPFMEFGDFIGVNSSEQLFFNYDSIHGSDRYSGIIVYDGYGQIIREYEQTPYFTPLGLYEGADGLTTIYGREWNQNSLHLVVYDRDLNVVLKRTINISLPSGSGYPTNNYRYIGDQKFFVFNSVGNSTLIDASHRSTTYPKLFEPTVASFDHIWYGGTSLQNQVQELIFRPTESASKSVGMAFRVTDQRNYYSVEFENNRIYLYRVRNGTKTNLRNTAFNLAAGSTYRVKVVPNGNRYQVYVNDIFQFEHADSQFSQGRMGIINRGATGVQYIEMSYSTPGVGAGSISGVALVNELIHYDVTYEDPEGDSKLSSGDRWVYTHNPNVFLNPQGTWSGSGQQRSSVVTSFAQPGEYNFTYRTQDNPHTSSAFSSYRKYSNTVSGTLRIHRAPIARFTVTEQSNHTLRYADTSYDPDRYDPANGNYSRENTGINYQTTRGILEHRWRWREAASSTYTSGILTNPSKAGEYIIELAVRDEYGAWSDWYSQTITVSGAAGRDDPPRAGFTVSPASTYRGVGVTINSTASDREDGARTNLEHAYYIRNLTTGGGESFQHNSRTNWTKSFTTLGSFEIRQVVKDSAGQTAQATRQVTISNRKPTAAVQLPGSTSSTNPQVLEDTRPTIRWTFSDQDSVDRQQRYQVRVSYTSSGVNVADSGIVEGNATQWRPTHGLPENVSLQVRVRVHDGFEWSNWSNSRYFIINTNKPPKADFDWSPKPVWEGDTIRIIDNASDPDGDALTYHYTIVSPSGGTTTTTSAEPSITNSVKGTYTVTQRVTDPSGEFDTITKTIIVGELDITGSVHHTAEWNNNRVLYNQKHTGTNNSPRAYNVFWRGEKFILEAETTNTGSSNTKPIYVEVTLVEEDITVRLNTTNQLLWRGELFEESFIDDLSDGSYTFRFEVLYDGPENEGTIKTDTVVIEISGNVFDFYRLQRTL